MNGKIKVPLLNLESVKPFEMIIYKFTNNINKMSYVGLSRHDTVNDRYGGKWYKQSHNQYLKNAVNFYGLNNFSVEILEKDIKTEKELGEKEKFYILKYNSFYPNGYNFTSGGEVGFAFSQETKDKMGEKRAKEYNLINYLGQEKHVKNLKKFCKENGYDYPSMKNMVRGTTLSSHGWSLKGVDPKDITIPNIIYKIESPDGQIIEFSHMGKFCKKMNLPSWAIQKLLCGIRLTPYKGWKRPGMDMSIQQIHDKYKGYKFLAPNGEVFLVDNVYSFAKEHPPLDRKDLYELINRRSHERKGWKLLEKDYG